MMTKFVNLYCLYSESELSLESLYSSESLFGVPIKTAGDTD